MRYLPNTLASFAAEAAEAVCLGEQLQQKDQEIEQAVRKQISQRSSEAIRKRHSKVAQLKQELFEYYATGDFPSKAQAVRRFINELTHDKRNLLAPTNAERTLLEALRSHLRSTTNTNNKN